MRARSVLRALAVCSALLWSAASATAEIQWSVGDRCLADWPLDEYWYPGTIIETAGSSYHVQFDDEDREWLAAPFLVRENLDPGDTVEARWMVGADYYAGRISERIGNVVHIQYDDGDEEWTTIAVVRVLPPSRDN